jgi:hypothetical protein
MAEQTNFSPAEDSVDLVELVMAIEEALIDRHLPPDERERLALEIAARMARGEFGDGGGFDDDDFAALVRKLGPSSPRGQAGAAAKVEEPFFE